MNFLKKTTVAFFLSFLIFSPLSTFAQEAESEVEAREEVVTEEEKKNVTTISELELEFPTISDNPSLVINFIDPSENKEGVHLDIDKKGFVAITSPYTLPALSIGDHLLKFKFVDKYGATQTIEKEIIAIPRAPILNTPVIEDSKITLSGSALSGSEVILLLSSDQKMITRTADVDDSGKWKIEITDSVPTGMYSFTAFIRKYGYASNLAESMTLDLANGEKPIVEEEAKQKIHFAFKDISVDNIKEIFSSNTDLIVILATSLVLGLFAGLMISNMSQKNKEKKEVEVASKSFEKPATDVDKPMTLRDKLLDKGVIIEEEKVEVIGELPELKKNESEEDVEAEPIVINEIKTVSKKAEVEEEKREGEKVMGKIDFLKNYKKHDPDDDKGKEKDVKVSLSSKPKSKK